MTVSIRKFRIFVLVSNRIEYWSNYSIIFEISNIRTSLTISDDDEDDRRRRRDWTSVVTGRPSWLDVRHSLKTVKHALWWCVQDFHSVRFSWFSRPWKLLKNAFVSGIVFVREKSLKLELKILGSPELLSGTGPEKSWQFELKVRKVKCKILKFWVSGVWVIHIW